MIPAVLLKNPLASGLGIALAATVAVAGVQTLRLAWAKSEIVAMQLAQERAINAAQARADALATDLLIAQASAMADTTRTVTRYVDRIHHVTTPDTACAADPRFVLGNHGVRDIVKGGSK